MSRRFANPPSYRVTFITAVIALSVVTSPAFVACLAGLYLFALLIAAGGHSDA